MAPKKTILPAGSASKLVPLIVTEVPIGPLVGVKEVIVGTKDSSAKRSAISDIQGFEYLDRARPGDGDHGSEWHGQNDAPEIDHASATA